MLNFIKCFLCIILYDCMVFMLWFIETVDYIDGFFNMEPALFTRIHPAWSWCVPLLYTAGLVCQLKNCLGLFVPVFLRQIALVLASQHELRDSPSPSSERCLGLLFILGIEILW